MSLDNNPLEPIADITETATGWSHLSKTALPLIGQVGAVIGGALSMLAAFQKISGEILVAVEGFVLVVGIIASSIVVFYRKSIIVDDQKRKVYGYTRRARVIASVVMTIGGILLVFFLGRLWTSANASGGSTSPARQTLLAGAGQTRPSDRLKGGPTLPPPTVNLTTAPSATTAATSTPTGTPLPPTKILTATPFPIDQIMDVSLLIKTGNDLLAAKRYLQAQFYFTRATFVEATNPDAQFGLGQAYFYQNNFNSAFDPFQISLRLNSKLHDAHAYLGWIYDYRQDRARAIAEYEVFLKAAPRDDPLRSDISDRIKLLMGTGSVPSLTPNVTPSMTPLSTVMPTSTATVSK